MNDLTKYSLIMLLAVFVSSCSQMALKKASQKQYESLLKEYLNLPVMTAYTAFFGATLINVFALKYVPLSFAPVIESCGYIFVAVLSRLFLKEQIGRRRAIGFALILTGVLIFSLPSL